MIHISRHFVTSGDPPKSFCRLENVGLEHSVTMGNHNLGVPFGSDNQL